MKLSAEELTIPGLQMPQMPSSNNMNSFGLRSRSNIDVRPLTCHKAWNLIFTRFFIGAMPKNLLWSFILLKKYQIDHQRREFGNEKERNRRKWTFLQKFTFRYISTKKS